MNALRPADRLSNSDEKVVGLLVDWGICLQEDAPIWGYPQRPA